MAQGGDSGAITDFFLQLGFDVSKVDEGLKDLTTKLKSFSSQSTINVGVKTSGSGNNLDRLKSQMDNLEVSARNFRDKTISDFGRGFSELNDATKDTRAFKELQSQMEEVNRAIEELGSNVPLTADQIRDYKNVIKSAQNNVSILRKENSRANSVFRVQTFMVQSLQQSLKNLAKSYLSAFAVIKGGKAFTDIGQSVMAARASLRLISESTEEADRNFEFVLATATKLGLELEDATRNFARIGIAARKAGLSIAETEEIFLGVSEATKAYHMTSDQTLLTFRAFDQMLSRGVVSMEEVRKQLGNNMPAAFYTAAEAMGYTDKQFDNLVVNGKVNSRDFVQNFSRHLRQVVRENDTYQASLETSQTAMQKFRQVWKGIVGESFKEGMDESLFNFFTAFSDLIKSSEPQIKFFASTFSFLIDVVTALIDLFSLITSSLNASWTLVKNITNDFWGFGSAVVKVFRTIDQYIAYLEVRTDKWKASFADGSAGMGDYIAAVAVSILGISVAIGVAIKTLSRFRAGWNLVRKAVDKVRLPKNTGKPNTGNKRPMATRNTPNVAKTLGRQALKRGLATIVGGLLGGPLGWIVSAAGVASLFKTGFDMFKEYKANRSDELLDRVYPNTSSGGNIANNIHFEINGVTEPVQVAKEVEKVLNSVYRNNMSLGAL